MASPRELRESLPKNFCPLPFTQLFLYPTGEVFPCCESGFKLGDLKSQTLAEVWNGEAAQALREEFLSGRTRTCSKQIRYKRCHLSTEELLASVVPAKVVEQPVRAFDLILNGKCNLECVMCPVWTLPNQVYDSSTFWQEGDRGVFAGLERVSVKSGEPFIQRDTYRLIDRVSAVNPSCKWTFTTNGQYKLSPAILAALDKVEIDSLKISVDSLEEKVYSSIRLRGDLRKTLATLEGFVSYRQRRAAEGRGFHLAVNMAVQRLNWREPPELVRYCERLGVAPIFLFVYDPGSQSLSSLSELEREKVLERYFLFLEESPTYLTQLSTLVLPLLDTLEEQARKSYLAKWKQMTLRAFFARTKPGAR